jgi:hypothetical protein
LKEIDVLKNKRIYFNLEKVSEGEIKLQTSFEKDEEKNVYLMGFASTPDVNSYDFIVENSAIINAWFECKKAGKNIAVYEKHDMPVGKVVSCEEMSGKILVILEIPKSGNDRLLSVYEQGIYVGLSVGGWRLDGKWDDNEEIFHITEFYWYEVSLTDVPSNENAVLLEGIPKPIKIKKDDIKKMLLEKVTQNIREIK